jgi:ubiquinone/menaquinone biosynthesis C-methylase UbiE/uncharacterized protein YbaR (Trm112 family)
VPPHAEIAPTDQEEEPAMSPTGLEDHQAQIVWICPRTRSSLVTDGASLVSQKGGHRYPIRNGVPCFLVDPPNESQESIDHFEKLNRLAAESGWREALKVLFEDQPGVIRYATDESRCGFLDLLALDGHMTALEIGTGMGAFSLALANRVAHLYGLELTEGQAQFCSLRCRQQGATNTTFACGGDDCNLPIADSTMDVVVLNLVLEWCSNSSRADAAADQALLLAEIFRVLKPGGMLYLTTKNRFALHYLLGKPDEHSYMMRFGNALPRALHRWLLRLKGYRRAPGMLHSHNHLRAMLVNAGFADARSYWAAPEMRYPEHYISNDSASISAARAERGFIQGSDRSSRLIMRMIPAGLVKHFTPGLTFLARKG